MKKSKLIYLIAILISIAIPISGCYTHVRVTRVDTDGKPVEVLDYTTFESKEISGLELVGPDKDGNGSRASLGKTSSKPDETMTEVINNALLLIKDLAVTKKGMAVP